MRRIATGNGAPAAPPPAAPPVVDPHAVCTVQDAIRLFHLRKSTIRRELKEGRLRVSKRAGRYYLLGSWLLEWIEGGEIRHAGEAQAERTQAAGETPTKARH